jgi:Transposase DDE domain
MPSTIPRVADAMHRVLTDVADEAARQSGFLRRRRKLSGATFVQALVFGWLANPDATAEERAQAAFVRGVHISAHGLDKRCDQRAAECLRRVLSAAVHELLSASDPVAVPILRRFSGVYVYDGSVVSLPAALREAWPGCGSGAPDGQSVAALKIGCRLDLLSGQLYGPVLKAGREHDRALELGAEQMPSGALRLADLGFFDLGLFRLLDQRGGYWLSRFKAGTAVFFEEEGDAAAPGRRLEMGAYLKGLTDEGEHYHERRVRLGLKQRLPARLLAVRLPEAVARKRRRRLRFRAKRRQEGRVSAERLELAGWECLITNAPPDLLGVQEAPVLMRARWQIERLFDLWKQHGHLDKTRSEKPHRVLCEVYAKLVGLLIQHWLILSAGGWERAERSLMKAGRTVRRWALALAEALDKPRRLAGVLRSIGRCLAVGCRVAKRRKEPRTAQQLLALTQGRKEAAIA